MNESDGDLVVRLVVDLVKAATKPLKAQIAALEIGYGCSMISETPPRSS